jgi:hypothetical protein
MLLSEAAKKNPEVASVLQSEGADRETLQRTLATVTAMNAMQSSQTNLGFGGNDPNRSSRFGNRPQKPK